MIPLLRPSVRASVSARTDNDERRIGEETGSNGGAVGRSDNDWISEGQATVSNVR